MTGTWAGRRYCDRCGRRAVRLIPAYWGGTILCADCCVVIAVAFDDLKLWPPDEYDPDAGF